MTEEQQPKATSTGGGSNNSNVMAKNGGGSKNPSATPLAVISQILSTPKKPNNNAFLKQFNFYILYGTLQMFYLLLSIYLTGMAYYHQLKMRFLMVFYHHNRTPQLIRNDVTSLSKIPGHVAIVINYMEQDEIEGGGVDGLLDQVGEVTAWCIGSGIKTLTVYERTGVLKSLDQQKVYNSLSRKLESYYGIRDRPQFNINIPHNSTSYANGSLKKGDKLDININLISEEDGRATIVDLSRTLAELACSHKISSKDLSIDIIDGEMNSLVIGEPDLLLLFTPGVDIQGFPPWQIRLSEIFHQPDNCEVSYGVFVKALKSYSNCKINVGR